MATGTQTQATDQQLVLDGALQAYRAARANETLRQREYMAVSEQRGRAHDQAEAAFRAASGVVTQRLRELRAALELEELDA